MKKTYINPTLKVVNIQAANILTGSNTIPVDPTTETSTQMSRRERHSVWDDEEEDEEDFY